MRGRHVPDHALDHVDFPYVFVDATYLNVRVPRPVASGQVASMAVVVATEVTADGPREILGLDVGDSEDEVFWRGFLTSLKAAGPGGVRLVISDQHAGLVGAPTLLPGRRTPTLPGPRRPQPARARRPKNQMDMVASPCSAPSSPNPTQRPWQPAGTRPGPARRPDPQDRPVHG